MPRPFVFATLLMLAQVTTPKCGEMPTSPSSPSAAAATTSPSVDVPAAPNVLPVAVNGGPTNNSLNQPFVTVTICVPGTSTCQSIGGILLDTGSVGLRILSSAVTLPLTQQTGSSGAALAECLSFVDGSIFWGPLQRADIRLSGEQASAATIQIIGTDAFAVPGGCAARGTPQSTLSDTHTNGIFGVGMVREDCGVNCSTTGSANPGWYYSCATSSTCQVAAVPLASQVQNPVSLFPVDNNGVVLRLPAIPAGGAPSAFGAVIFGIGTQSNNGLGSARVFTVDSRGNFTTSFNGQTYTRTFLDSGSNGIFFLDAATTGLPGCAKSTGFYCPPAVRALSATHTGVNGTSAVVAFNAGNVDQVNATFSVFGEATGSQAGTFDWGLPFFYGRTVFTAIQGAPTPAGPGPFWAY